jgi:hypothetical protein
VSKIFLTNEDLPTSRRGASPAATPAKVAEDNSVKCLIPLALRVESPAKFLFSQGMTVQFIAANVFLTIDKTPNCFLEYALRGVFLFLLNGFGLDAGDIIPHIFAATAQSLRQTATSRSSPPPRVSNPLSSSFAFINDQFTICSPDLINVLSG